ncbi:MAG: outer membrane beta-barrel protein [Candidatus Kuenenia stuttgartiensis]|nr:outer membrane beta-barrel protein [Candidatus Kuenenia stuttgartiensis]
MLERLVCSLSIFYGEGEYVSSSFEQRLLGVNSSLNYDISRNLKGSLAYTYSQLGSNSETAEYSKNTIFLGLTAGF